jgi:hypothetical protein
MARSRRRELHTALYTKDTDLFAQRMPYTLNGVTWWATPCCYCGDPATGQDHVFPVAALNKLVAAGASKLPRDILRIVPSCRECNSLAGDRIFYTFEEKRLYVKAKIGARYSQQLDMPDWDPEELAELQGRMQDWITHAQGLREMVFERLRF